MLVQVQVGLILLEVVETVTLENGPTFSSANGGIFNFDGSNDFVSIPTWTLSPPWTVNFWCRTSSGG